MADSTTGKLNQLAFSGTRFISEIKHRTIDTNHIRIHVTEMGEGPTVLTIHGFPKPWYSWREQLP